MDHDSSAGSQVDSKRLVSRLAGVIFLIAASALVVAALLPRFPSSEPTPRTEVVRAGIGRTGPFAKALDLYRIATGTYPVGEDGLLKLIHKPKDPNQAREWRGPYLEDEDSLKDPRGHLYRYRFPGKHNRDGYDLWCVGPDGLDGTEDDITNWALYEDVQPSNRTPSTARGG